LGNPLLPCTICYRPIELAVKEQSLNEDPATVARARGLPTPQAPPAASATPGASRSVGGKGKAVGWQRKQPAKQPSIPQNDGQDDDEEGLLAAYDTVTDAEIPAAAAAAAAGGASSAAAPPATPREGSSVPNPDQVAKPDDVVKLSKAQLREGWLVEGHPFLGRLIRRDFSKTEEGGWVDGHILAWLPKKAGEEEEYFYNMMSDGDNEDLDHAEAVAGMAEATRPPLHVHIQ